MIFLNRKRTITEKPLVKDPSKYWYIEKYVYGELIETVEVALGSSTKFTGIESGYEDDWFEGWSTSSTSTTRTFNTSTAYKNTTTAVKKKLDSNNTIKIYAVYAYSTSSTKSITNSASISTTGSTTSTKKLIVKESGTITISGYTTTINSTIVEGETKGSTTTYGSVSINIYDINGNKKSSVSASKSSSSQKSVEIGDKILSTITASYNYPTGSTGSNGAISRPNGTATKVSGTATISCTGSMYNLSSPKYRVTSHT